MIEQLPSTFLNRSPWEMFWPTMKPVMRWWTGPASPQWGLKTKVENPRDLQTKKACLSSFARKIGNWAVTIWILSKEKFKRKLPSELIEHNQICIHKVEIVSIRWVLIFCPVLGGRCILVKHNPLWFWFVIDWI